MRVAINGFGRIGRLILRAFFESLKKYDFEIVAINDLQDMDTAMHLLKYDSVHGGLNFKLTKLSENEFSIDDNKIIYLSQRDPNKLPWKDLSVDLVMECTGIFKTRAMCQLHINAGAKKVLLSCPSDDVDRMIVFGINNSELQNSDMIISNASCTTNCLAPIVHIIHNDFKIEHGFATTIHSYTGDQNLVDTYHKDLRRARAAALSMIPTSTGATNAIEKIFPDLRGRLSGLSVRVPTANVSMVDFSFVSGRKISVQSINDSIKKYADSSFEKLGVLSYTNEELVSLDFNHSFFSAVVDCKLTKVVGDTFGHIVVWYDNEWGFSNRMLDTAQLIVE